MKLRLTLGLLGVMHAAILLAAWVAPYDYAEQHRESPYAPPSRIHWAGWRPVVYGLSMDTGSGDYKEDAGRRYPVEVFTRGRLIGVAAPGVLFPWGTDGLGRDVFSRVLYGDRFRC